MKNTLKQFRKSMGFSQSNVANKMGISRPTYDAIEKGEKDLTLSKIQQLSDILETTPESFLENFLVKEKLPQNRKKFREVILNCIKFGADMDGKITKTKLAKLVYLCDFLSFYENLEPLSGLEYRRLPQGPVAIEYFEIIDSDTALNIEAKQRAMMISLVEDSGAESNELSVNELELVKKVCEKWKNQSTDSIVNFTHQQIPWKICREGEIIPYELIHNEEPENVY